MLRQNLHAKLGGWPAPRPAAARTLRVRTAGGLVAEELILEPTRTTAAWPGEPIPALLTRPIGGGPFPAGLYVHAHGGQYAVGRRELLDGRQALPEGAYAGPLAKLGIAALCLDLPCFGDRRHWQEAALAKRLLWQGDTLFGVMLRELAGGLDYLHARADIDARRIAALGLSMGSTLSWWLAALDRRIRAVAELCCLADLQTLIELDHHDRHEIYMMVPGLVRDHATADIAALIAPRPHLACIGAKDPLTPPCAVDRVLEPLQRAYAAEGAADALQLLIAPDSGHVETPAMRRAVLQFLGSRLTAARLARP